VVQTSPPLLQLSGIDKRFGSTHALRGVSLAVDSGEAVALIGENGAGKSTLMKVLAGIVSPDEGEIRLSGKLVTFPTPRAAMDAGVALIHQELNLHEHLSVAENLFLGREPRRNGWGLLRRIGWLDRTAMSSQAEYWLQQVGLSVSPSAPVETLPIASKQLLEIARALSTNARVVVMDEPTSSLSDDEALRLFGLIKQLQSRGVAVIYISHRLGEVVRLADRVDVLRDGSHVATLHQDEITPPAMVRAMVGRELAARQSTRRTTESKTRLSVQDLRVESVNAPPVSFQVAAGEVVALVGLVGAGRSEILETIFGIRHRATGSVRVDDQTVGDDIEGAIRAGISFVPEDRKQTGLLIQSSVTDNATIVAMGRVPHSTNRMRAIRGSWQSATTRHLIERLGIKTSTPDTPLASLSGGNQQKVALSKWLPCDGTVFMLDEPTRGVDIGAKAEIYALIDQLAADGKAILVVSSEMEEVFAIADRALVIADGRIAGELPRDQFSEEAIMRIAVGGVSGDGAASEAPVGASEPKSEPKSETKADVDAAKR